MVRVEVKNFQSIAHEVVEIDGFSALVGRSNIGKSAIVRAIKAALTGAPADNYVRHDALCLRLVKGSKTCKCFCSVHITAPELDLLWEKGDAVNRYIHNGTEHTVVGRGTPDFLTDGFALVKIGDDKTLLQVSDQFQPIFILDRSGTVVADVLSDVAKLDEINVAMRLVEKDRKEAVATRKVREKDIQDIRSSLMRYEGFDEAVLRVRRIEEQDQQTEAAAQRLTQLETFVESALSVARRIKSLDQIGSVIVPEITGLQQNGTKFAALGEFEIELLARTRAVAGLEGVEGINTPDLAGFVDLGSSYQRLIRWSSKVDGLRGFFDRTQKLASVAVPEFGPVEGAKVLYTKLDTWVDQLNGIGRMFTNLKVSMDAAVALEASVLAEFQALGVCPTCNREFTSDHPQHEVA